MNEENKNLKKILKKIQTILENDYCFVPFDIKNIIHKNIKKCKSKNYINRKEIWNIVNNFCNNLVYNIYPNIKNKYQIKIFNERLLTSKVIIYQDLNSSYLYSIKITKECLNFILSDILLNIKKGLISPGESVGVSAALATGSKNTQLNLNTFHFAGREAKVTGNMARLIQILSVSKKRNNSYNTIFLPDNSSFEYAKNILKKFKSLKIKDLIENIQIIYDPEISKGITFITEDSKHIKYYSKKIKIKTPLHIRIIFDLKKMFSNKIKLLEISQILYSKKFVTIEIKKNIIRIIPYELNSINELNNIINEIEEKKIAGINNIINATITPNPINLKKYDEKGNQKNLKEYVITTNGINLLEVMKIKGINHERIMTNDIFEAYEIFGIEAARLVIINELIGIYRDNGISDILPHHIYSLANYMTFNGKPVGLNYYGMEKTKEIQPFQKISHERFLKSINNASYTGEIDKIESASAGIYTGGSGLFGSQLSGIRI
jgi:DNA-directed RNA polymerase beta' subunit